MVLGILLKTLMSYRLLINNLVFPYYFVEVAIILHPWRFKTAPFGEIKNQKGLPFPERVNNFGFNSILLLFRRLNINIACFISPFFQISDGGSEVVSTFLKRFSFWAKLVKLWLGNFLFHCYFVEYSSYWMVLLWMFSKLELMKNTMIRKETSFSFQFSLHTFQNHRRKKTKLSNKNTNFEIWSLSIVTRNNDKKYF